MQEEYPVTCCPVRRYREKMEWICLMLIILFSDSKMYKIIVTKLDMKKTCNKVEKH